jgi:hypothetical protein
MAAKVLNDIRPQRLINSMAQSFSKISSRVTEFTAFTSPTDTWSWRWTACPWKWKHYDLSKRRELQHSFTFQTGIFSNTAARTTNWNLQQPHCENHKLESSATPLREPQTGIFSNSTVKTTNWNLQQLRCENHKLESPATPLWEPQTRIFSNTAVRTTNWNLQQLRCENHKAHTYSRALKKKNTNSGFIHRNSTQSTHHTSLQ